MHYICHSPKPSTHSLTGTLGPNNPIPDMKNCVFLVLNGKSLPHLFLELPSFFTCQIQKTGLSFFYQAWKLLAAPDDCVLLLVPSSADASTTDAKSTAVLSIQVERAKSINSISHAQHPDNSSCLIILSGYRLLF